MSKTTIICWPAVQKLMDQEGFRTHSALCNSHELHSQYGDSSYAVEDNWLKNLDAELIDKVMSMQEAYEGPEVDFNQSEEFFTI